MALFISKGRLNDGNFIDWKLDINKELKFMFFSLKHFIIFIIETSYLIFATFFNSHIGTETLNWLQNSYKKTTFYNFYMISHICVIFILYEVFKNNK